MSKLELWSQERMDMKTVPLPDKRGYKSFVEYIEDDAVPSEKKSISFGSLHICQRLTA